MNRRLLYVPIFLAAWMLASPGIASAEQESEPLRLFNGKNLDGWTCYLGDSDKKIDDVWSVDAGVLRCTGKPVGYLVTTKRDFADYVLQLEWRWPGKPGNNGVLVHCGKKNALGVWPKSLEVQLQHQHAGDFWVIGAEIQIENVDERRQGRRHTNLTDDSEKPLGQWNHMEITCRDDEVSVRVNGDLVNHCTQCSERRGAIALQSEGAPIEYRNITLRPLQP